MSETRVGIIASTTGTVAGLDPRAALAACGNNTGNLLFHYAVPRLIESPFERFGWDSDPEVVRGSCDVLVIPEANAINPNRSYEARAEFLRSVDLPCVVSGLGAQAPSIGDEIVLQSGTEEYLHELSARTTFLGVRGEYTADVLAAIGIRNTVVTGCPSNLIELDPSLANRLCERVVGESPRLQVGAGDMKRSLRHIERRLFGWGMRDKNRYLLQSGIGVLVSCGVEGTIEDQRKIFRHLGIRRRDRGEFIRQFHNKSEVFFDAEAWLDTSSAYELSISSRVHSTICALQAGVPAVVIRHDSRTDELRRTHAIPSVSIDQAESCSNPTEIYASSVPQWEAYRKTRVQLGREIVALHHAASIRCTPSLIRFTGLDQLSET